MLTFREYVRDQSQNPRTQFGIPTTGYANCEAKVNRAARRDEEILHLSERSDGSSLSISDLTTRFSEDIVNLNDAMCSDVSCSVADRRISQVLLNLHYLTLIAISGGSYDRVGTAPNS